MNRRNRFKKRKMLLEKSKNTILVNNDVDNVMVQEFLTSEIDNLSVERHFDTMEKHYDFKYDFYVSDDEAKDFLERFKKEFNDERFSQLVGDCKREVINSIVTPFGLGKIVSAYDKVGGNVDTIHNAREGIYATEEAQKAYDNRGDYNSDDYHKDKNFIDINRKYSKVKKEGKELADYMTGEKIKQNDNHDLDHVVSAKEIHDDAGRVLADIEGNRLANTDVNLKPTDSSINRSKKADTMEDFIARKNENIKNMKILKSKKYLSEKEQRELKKLEKQNMIDDKKAMETDKKARDEQNSTINKEYYASQKFAKDAALASGKEGVSMGMQQAIGLVMTEFFTAFFDEIIDIYKNGFSNGFDNDEFFKILKSRLERIATRLKEKWKDVAIAFKDGFLSGFISNLVTTVINAFVATGKRVVRIIREGIFSLFRAVKLLLFPPKNMTYHEAMHEAKKLIASGLIISLGIIAEEYIEKLLHSTGALSPFANVLTTIFVGAITGLAITMTVYYIDKKKNDKEMVESLVSNTNEKFEVAEKLLKELVEYNPLGQE